MANPEHVNIVKGDQHEFNLWREKHLGVVLDLKGADFSDDDLAHKRIQNADSRGAKFIRTDLSGADLKGADLKGADLRRADLIGADLRGADLRRADLRRAKCFRATMVNVIFGEGTDISKADFRECSVNGTNFSKVKGITKAKNLKQLGRYLQTRTYTTSASVNAPGTNTS